MKKLLLLPAVLAFTTLHAAAAEEPTNFIRFVEEAKTDSLQTAVMSYVSPQKIKVDLIGAIHIADKAYFDGLNLSFKKYDAVLYELVGPAFEDRDAPEVQQEASKLQWVGHLQTMMRDALKLHGQLEGIDYRATNFVHADMDLSQFSNTQTQKQESFFSLYLKAMKAQEAANEKRGGSSSSSGIAGLLKIFTVKDSSTELKRVIAREFDTVEDIMAGIESGDGTVIVGERNKFALRVLDNQIAIGRKNLAIFYGAAHLGDMEQRLLKKGYTRTAVSWLKAWDLPHAE